MPLHAPPPRVQNPTVLADKGVRAFPTFQVAVVNTIAALGTSAAWTVTRRASVLRGAPHGGDILWRRRGPPHVDHRAARGGGQCTGEGRPSHASLAVLPAESEGARCVSLQALPAPGRRAREVLAGALPRACAPVDRADPPVQLQGLQV
jgi:hypothetical protein